MGQIKPPVKVDEELELTITAIGKRGDGISKINGYTIFVPESHIDDTIKVKITKVMDRFAFATIMN